MAVPDGDVQQAWDVLLAEAQRDDATWVPGRWPPIRTALVVAARGSALGAFYPFVSVNGLWFMSQDRRFPDDFPDNVLPVGMGHGDEYVVWWCDHPFRDAWRPVVQLLTADSVRPSVWPCYWPVRGCPSDPVWSVEIGRDRELI